MKRLVILGDSLSMPRPDDDIDFRATYPSLLAESLKDKDIHIINRARRRNDTKLQLESQNMADDIDFLKPDYVVIQLGIVDCAPRLFTRRESTYLSKINYVGPYIIKIASRNRKMLTKLRSIQYVPILQYIDNMKTLIKRTKIHTKNIFVCSIAQTNTQNENRSHDFANLIRNYNDELIKLVISEQLTMIDLNTYGQSILLNDGIHLNKSGNALVAKLIKEAIKKC